MAFKNIKIVGDGLAQTVLTNSATLEGVVTNLVAYNGTAGALSFSLLIGGVSVITESVPANDSYRLPDKINVPVSGVLTINAATGVDVTISSYQAAIDTAAALTAAQTTATTTAGYLADFQADYIGKYADDAAADASGFTIGAGVFYFKNTGTPATSGLRIYNGGWDAAALDASGALLDIEVTNLAQVKAFDSSDYATAAQGTLAANAMPIAGGTFTGLAKAPAYEDAVVVLTGTTPEIDLSVAGEYRLTTTGNTTFTVSNPPADGFTTTKTLRITQTTLRTVTFWSGIQTVDGAVPAAPLANKTNEYTLRASNVGGTTTYVLTETGEVS